MINKSIQLPLSTKVIDTHTSAPRSGVPFQPGVAVHGLAFILRINIIIWCSYIYNPYQT